MATPAGDCRNLQASGRLAARLLLLGRVALGLIFVFAAYAKLHFDGAWHFGDYHFFFAMAIDSYKILPIADSRIDGARSCPGLNCFLESWLIAGISFALGRPRLRSALLLVFIAAMVRAKILGLEINCGCFGNNEKLGTWTLVRDSSLLVLALAVTIGAFLIKKRKITVSS